MLSESARRVRCPSHLRLGDAEMDEISSGWRGFMKFMGIYSLVGMMQTCVNVTGDATVTTIVARSEGLIDLEKFRS